jgi:hypothetical protein
MKSRIVHQITAAEELTDGMSSDRSPEKILKVITKRIKVTWEDFCNDRDSFL